MGLATHCFPFGFGRSQHGGTLASKWSFAFLFPLLAMIYLHQTFITQSKAIVYLLPPPCPWSRNPKALTSLWKHWHHSDSGAHQHSWCIWRPRNSLMPTVGLQFWDESVLHNKNKKLHTLVATVSANIIPFRSVQFNNQFSGLVVLWAARLVRCRHSLLRASQKEDIQWPKWRSSALFVHSIAHA